MASILNFVFLSDVLESNGDSSYAMTGPLFYYLINNDFSYTLNGELDDTKPNVLLIEGNHKFESLLHISDDIFEYIKTHNVKLFFVSLPDPCNEPTFVLGRKFLKTKLPREKYILLDSNTRLPDIYSFDFFLEEATWNRHHNFDTMPNELGYVSEDIQINELDRFRNKKFLSFNRNVDKPHRISLFYEYLTNDYSDSYFTFLMNVEGHSSPYGMKRNSIPNEFFNKHIPIELDTFKAKDKSNFRIASTFKKDLFLDSCINLVTETSFDGEELFVSEKILKPIIGYQPFIVFSSYGYLKHLKKYGFKTFSDFWDESYDDIPNQYNRWNALLKLVRELNSKSIEELNQIYKSTKDICIHNRQVFDSLEINTLEKIFQKIKDEW